MPDPTPHTTPDRSLARRLRKGPTGSDPSPVADLVAAALDAADRAGEVDVAWTRLDSPIGDLVVAVTDEGLVRVGFAHEDHVLDELAAQVSPRIVAVSRRTDPVRRQLDEYFEGRRTRFDLPLDWRLTRGFRRTVLEALAAGVPHGAVVSYKDLAVVAGNPGASRAVGTAMATNPIPVVVPCHRVLRTGGALGGYGGGLDTKRWLLTHEGVTLA
jgi:methylated-DNA-[protein]-cysteine S-methyltransferase